LIFRLPCSATSLTLPPDAGQLPARLTRVPGT